MSLKMLCLISLFSAILFVQEEALTMVPNVQLTFLLVCVYSATIGLKYSSIIILVHVLLDNLFMNTFNLYCMVPQYIGLFIACLFGYLFRNKNEYIQGIFSSLAALIYCILYLLVNIWFLDAKFIPYLIADIPFEIILMVSSFITIIFLYKPLVKVIKNFLKDDEEKLY